MRERDHIAATRGAIVALSIYLVGIAIGKFPLRPLYSVRTIVFGGIFILAWILVTIWQARSQVERWSWGSLSLGFVLMSVCSSIGFVAAVHLWVFIRFGR